MFTDYEILDYEYVNSCLISETQTGPQIGDQNAPLKQLYVIKVPGL